MQLSAVLATAPTAKPFRNIAHPLPACPWAQVPVFPCSAGETQEEDH